MDGSGSVARRQTHMLVQAFPSFPAPRPSPEHISSSAPIQETSRKGGQPGAVWISVNVKREGPAPFAEPEPEPEPGPERVFKTGLAERASLSAPSFLARGVSVGSLLI